MSNEINETVWEEFLNRATDEDSRQITEWNKSLNTLLVYVCFFRAYDFQIDSKLF